MVQSNIPKRGCPYGHAQESESHMVAPARVFIHQKKKINSRDKQVVSPFIYLYFLSWSLKTPLIFIFVFGQDWVKQSLTAKTSFNF